MRPGAPAVLLVRFRGTAPSSCSQARISDPGCSGCFCRGWSRGTTLLLTIWTWRAGRVEARDRRCRRSSPRDRPTKCSCTRHSLAAPGRSTPGSMGLLPCALNRATARCGPTTRTVSSSSRPAKDFWIVAELASAGGCPAAAGAFRCAGAV